MTIQQSFFPQLLADAATERMATQGSLDITEYSFERPVRRGSQAVDVLHRFQIHLIGSVQEGQEQIFGRLCIVQSTVGVGQVNAQVLGQPGQTVATGMGQQDPGHLKGIDAGIVQKQPLLMEKG